LFWKLYEQSSCKFDQATGNSTPYPHQTCMHIIGERGQYKCQPWYMYQLFYKCMSPDTSLCFVRFNDTKPLWTVLQNIKKLMFIHSPQTLAKQHTCRQTAHTRIRRLIRIAAIWLSNNYLTKDWRRRTKQVLV